MISTERLNLWPLEPQDLAQNYRWANDSELCRLAGALPMPKSFRDMEGWLNSSATDPEVHVFSMKLKDGTNIGNIEIRDLDLRCASCELGLMIGDRSQRGRGYGSEAVKALCSFCFNQLRLNRVKVRVLQYNDSAFAMFHKCGFTFEGTERQAFWQDGKFWDIRILSMLKDEFSEK